MAINGEIINLIVDEYITLDFDLENATKGTLNRNNCVEGEYTSFKSGINTITVSSLATKIEITPNFRWY
jgi:phage-related protein